MTENNKTPALSVISPLSGGLVLVGVIVVVVAFVIMSRALGIADNWPGFLFLFYWAGVDQTHMNRWLPDAVGSIVGVLISYGLMVMPSMGVVEIVVIFGILLLAIYCSIMKWLSSVINMPTMLFLTVATAPAINAMTPFSALLSSLGLGILFFGALGGVAVLLSRRRMKLAS